MAHGQAVVVCGSEGSAGLLEGLPSPLEEREEPARSMQPARGGAGGGRGAADRVALQAVAAARARSAPCG